MKSLSRYLVVSVLLLSAVALASGALARGGHRGGRGGGAGGASLCSSAALLDLRDRKSTRLNSSHLGISYAVFCLKKKKKRLKATAKYLFYGLSLRSTLSHRTA